MYTVEQFLFEGVEFQFGAVYAQYLLHHLFRFRTLYGKLAQFVAQIVYLHVVPLCVTLYPGNILRYVRGVDYKQEVVFVTFIHQKVVYRAPLVVQHHAVEYLSYGCACHIVGEYVVHIFLGLRARYVHLAHVRYIKHSARRAHCIMLLRDAGILYRHVKSSERAHLCARFHVPLMQAGFLNIFHIFKIIFL